MSSTASLVPAGVPPLVPLRSDWVLAGRPAHRTWEMATARGMTTGQWDCTAGRFVWDFGRCDEIIHVLEGSVHVTGPDGATLVLDEGACHVFGHGTRWEWHVPVYVRKAYVIRDRRSVGRRALDAPRAVARHVRARLVRPAS